MTIAPPCLLNTAVLHIQFSSMDGKLLVMCSDYVLLLARKSLVSPVSWSYHQDV